MDELFSAFLLSNSGAGYHVVKALMFYLGISLVFQDGTLEIPFALVRSSREADFLLDSMFIKAVVQKAVGCYHNVII